MLRMIGVGCPASTVSTACAVVNESTAYGYVFLAVQALGLRACLCVSICHHRPLRGFMSGKESDDLYSYSPACKAVADVTVSVGASLTLDSFQRLIYERINHNIQEQANRLLLRGEYHSA